MADTQAIKDKIDIVQLILEYLPLKKAGSNWKAPCPFHHEKSPSFMVHAEKQIWHCFGCGKGGDIFSFIQEMEGLDFAESLKLLADRAGIKLENTFQSEAVKSQKVRLQEINEKAANFFHRFLLEMKASALARDYLCVQRGLSVATIEEWKIGYVPDQWDLLTQYLLKKGYGIDDLVSAGLVVKNEERRSHYDRFRGRIMFPLWDVHGNVAGFTGRILVEKENSGGKYVNTPQTVLYDKSRILYGLNKAKQEIKAKDLCVVVEGQMDVIACHTAGMKNVVAASGTALTDEQVRLIKRYTQNVAMAFDADSAGENAAKRGIDVALAAGLNIKVIKIPEGAGKDADECLKKNRAIWFESVDNATGIMDWYFANTFKKINLSDFKERQRAADLLLAEIAKIPFAIERESWIKKLSEMLGADTAVLIESMKQNQKKNAAAPSAGYRHESVQIAPAPALGGDRLEMLRNKFWAVCVKQPSIFSALHGYIKPDYFSDSAYSPLYDFAENHYNNDGLKSFEGVSTASETGEHLVDLLYMQAEKDYDGWQKADFTKEAELILQEIEKVWLKNRRDSLKRELKIAQENGDTAKENNLLQQIMSLTN